MEGAFAMEEGKKWTLPPRDQILREIEEDQILIKRSEQRCAEAPQVIQEAKESAKRLREIINQLART